MERDASSREPTTEGADAPSVSSVGCDTIAACIDLTYLEVYEKKRLTPNHRRTPPAQNTTQQNTQP